MTKINSQNNKTKIATTLAAITMMALVLFPPVLPYANATNQPSSNCIDQANKDAFAKSSQLDEEKAKSLAMSNSEFVSRTLNHSVTYGSTFNIWNLDKTNCTAEWHTVNVVFFIEDNQGRDAQNLVFTMDPGLTKISAVDEYAATYQTNSQNWAGYEFSANAGNTTTITSTYASFSVPSVSEPSGIICYEHTTSPLSEECDMSTWTGLENAWGVTQNGHLVQTGTESIVNCNSSGNSCSNSYDLWYEALPNAEVPCTGVTVSHGDSMSVQITQESAHHSNYDISDTDGTTSKMCTATISGYVMSNPTISSFIDERPYDNTNKAYLHLPQFSSNSISGDITYSGSPNSIYTPYSSGYYVAYTMVNGGTTNISTGAVGTSGSFTETWSSSAHT
jgi:hypothetical protein